jgi:adenine/guanine phosphoribosyltransferase-like PRPP-binding protein
MWECPNCNLKLQKFIYPVHCRCGYVDKTVLVKKTPLAPDNAVVEFITIERLVRNAFILATLLPKNITRIIGVPRSGMLPASIIATHLHLPLYSVVGERIVPFGDNFKLNYVGGGFRTINTYDFLKDDGVWLFVDDTIGSGNSYRKIFEKLKVDNSYLISAIFSTKRLDLDFYAEELQDPHLLEWNMFNSRFVRHFATDMDGIICQNPPYSERPLYLIRFNPVKAIITARYEGIRQQTVEWLQAWGVQYDRLIMYPKEDNRNLEEVAKWKADQVKLLDVDGYIESEPILSDRIREHGVKVLCPSQGFFL